MCWIHTRIVCSISCTFLVCKLYQLVEGAWLKIYSAIPLFHTNCYHNIYCEGNFQRREWKFRHHLEWQMDICVRVFQRSKYKSKEHQLFDSICIAVLSSDAAIECKFLSSVLRWEEWTDAKNCANCDCNKILHFTSLLCTVF